MLFLRYFFFLSVVLASPVQAQLQVSVGIDPMRYLLDQIGGERVIVSTLLSNGDPHALDPTPKQLLALKGADVYFGVGLPFERGLGERLGSSDKLIWLDESDDDQRQEGDRSSEAQKPNDTQADEHHNHSQIDGKDPHRWTSPREMLRMGSLASQALQQLDPSGRAYYSERMDAFKERVETLQQSLAVKLKDSASTIVADHPSWGWFCQEFKLIQLSVEHEGKLPSIRQMSDLKKTASKNGARFVVSQHGGAQAQTVASHLGLKLLVINPLSYDWEVTLLSLADGLSAP